MLVSQNALTKRCPVDMSASGKSGARFLTSYDKRFVIKAMSTDEVAKMLRILKEYHQVRLLWRAFLIIETWRKIKLYFK